MDFPLFSSARMGQKIQLSAEDDLFRGSLGKSRLSDGILIERT